MTRAARFISAYNRIDRKLRTLFRVRNTSSFSDAVRRAATQSAVVRKYEDDLLDYARLRNAIVHNSDTDMIIAEPHESVVKKIEHIEQLLLRPPHAVGTVAKPAVTVGGETKLRQVIRIMTEGDYSNLPVITGGEIAGVINNKRIVESIAAALADGKDADGYLSGASADSILKGSTRHYRIMPDSATVEEVLNEFTADRKLQIILFTPGGAYDAPIRGVVTTGDLIDVNRIMDDY